MTQERLKAEQFLCQHIFDPTQWSAELGSPTIKYHCPKCQKTIRVKHIEDLTPESFYIVSKVMQGEEFNDTDWVIAQRGIF